MPLHLSSIPCLLMALVVLSSHFCGSMAFAPTTGTSSMSTNKPSVIGMAPLISPTTTTMSAITTTTNSMSEEASPRKHEQARQDWIERSVSYYSKVMREERRRTIGQLPDVVVDTPQYQEEFVLLAKKHYFAIRKVKDGKFTQAETLYRKIIEEILHNTDEQECDHAKLAVTTLLLALLTKRMGDPKKTRSVFLQFFRIAVLEREGDTECACSAKVLQAYALFEMQQGNSFKSVELVKKALDFDKTLAPVLKWKQFRDAQHGKLKSRRQQQQHHHQRSFATQTPAP
ncbi:expressed unknown protein [Seminavis robusta]|uniref:Uncharacterized protein n=1 Tax=Seminavis robusta TaxID=568900 RepID=A0A9N8DHJ7_9STRA|nr:expressed unknown protein [Seminavis robusta]|eukprot:Sro131_g062230.1 n/a (286) ;mRNA; f:43632-44489